MSNREIKNLQKLVQEYNEELLKIDSSKKISNLFYERDKKLCEIIEKCKPPYYIKYKLFNYRAILLYFIENFKNDMNIIIPEIDNKINIITTTDNLFHLLNIPNKGKYLQRERIHAKIIYDQLEFRNYKGGKAEHFEHKIASIGWVKDTLEQPDFVYDKHVNISKNLKFDFLFVRESGKGTKSYPYMYHLVAIKKRDRRYNYVINSQFPIKKDDKYSFEERKISKLHDFVHCDRPIFHRKGKELPKSKNDLDGGDLMNFFQDRDI